MEPGPVCPRLAYGKNQQVSGDSDARRFLPRLPPTVTSRLADFIAEMSGFCVLDLELAFCLAFEGLQSVKSF